MEMAELVRQTELAGVQERNRLHRATRNEAWLSAVPHHLNVMEMYWKKFRDSLSLRYGLIHQNFPATCDGYGKKFLIHHAPSCPKGGLVLEQHYDTVKEWGTLISWALVPSAITYKPKIKSRAVQGERTRAGAWQEGGIVEGGAYIVGESQESGGNGRIVNGADRLVGQPGQVEVTEDRR